VPSITLGVIVNDKGTVSRVVSQIAFARTQQRAVAASGCSDRGRELTLCRLPPRSVHSPFAVDNHRAIILFPVMALHLLHRAAAARDARIRVTAVIVKQVGGQIVVNHHGPQMIALHRRSAAVARFAILHRPRQRPIHFAVDRRHRRGRHRLFGAIAVIAARSRT